MNSLIKPDMHYAVAAALFAIALFGLWAERKPWGKLLTGAVWAIVAAILASNIGLIPKSSSTYSFVFSYLVPVLIPLFLMQANIRQILKESGRVGFAFLIACIGTTFGSIIGITVLDLGNNEAALAGIFTATYTGGSVNYAAVIQATGFKDANIISAATAVDNLMSALFLAALALMPASRKLMSFYVRREHNETPPLRPNTKESSDSTAFSLAITLTFAISVVAISDMIVLGINSLQSTFDASRLRYIFITLIAIAPATIAPQAADKLRGGKDLGIILAFVFFAAIAAGADIAKLVSAAPILLGFVAVILTTHACVTFGAGALLNKLATRTNQPHLAPSLPELIVASNAAILGATTAPALAVARGWPALATPGVLAGVGGYIIGTPLGILVASLF